MWENLNDNYVGWLNEKRLIPLVTNSRRNLRNDTTRRWQILSEFHRIQIAPHSMNFLWSLVGVVRQQTVRRRNDFARWMTEINRSIFATNRVAARFFLQCTCRAEKEYITRIKWKRRPFALRNRNKMRVVSITSWRYFSTFSFIKSGSRYSLARWLAYQWSAQSGSLRA